MHRHPKLVTGENCQFANRDLSSSTSQQPGVSRPAAHRRKGAIRVCILRTTAGCKGNKILSSEHVNFFNPTRAMNRKAVVHVQCSVAVARTNGQQMSICHVQVTSHQSLGNHLKANEPCPRHSTTFPHICHTFHTNGTTRNGQLEMKNFSGYLFRSWIPSSHYTTTNIQVMYDVVNKCVGSIVNPFITH